LFQEEALKRLDDDPTDDKQPHAAKIALSVGMIVFMPFMGAIFFSLNEGWDFATAFYWSFGTCALI
jgi:hypothetical protein